LSVAVVLLLAGVAMSDFMSDTLKAHKKYRKKHGAKKLKWDEGIAKGAQEWCDTLAENDKFEHNPDTKYGENLYKSWGSSSDGAGKRAVDSWYDEEKDYDYANPGKPASGKTVGHFTQIVWKSSKLLGCGVTKKGSSTWVCCNYDPPGNFDTKEQYEANVAKPQS